MRKVIVTMLTSLDGYVADADGSFEKMPIDESFSAYNVERLREAETLLLGATTYRGFLQYWPPVARRRVAAAGGARDLPAQRCDGEGGGLGLAHCCRHRDREDVTRIVKRADAHEAVRSSGRARAATS